MVVDVSPWHNATSFGRTCLIAVSICSGVKTVPHCVSRGVTCAPQRVAISTSRWPKRPKIGTRTLSPGSISDTRAASIAARAVPSISMVQRFCVWNTPR